MENENSVIPQMIHALTLLAVFEVKVLVRISTMGLLTAAETRDAETMVERVL